MDTSLTRAFDLLGKRWNGMLLFALGDGPAGFSELKRRFGISDSVLSKRLMELSRAGLTVRTVVAGPPVGVTYSLTARGRELLPVLAALDEWALAHLAERLSSPNDAPAARE